MFHFEKCVVKKELFLIIHTEPHVYTKYQSDTCIVIDQNAASDIWRDAAKNLLVQDNGGECEKILILTGGHGDANIHTGEPTLLNNDPIARVREKIVALKEEIKFDSVLLTTCDSASCIPLFKDLLSDNGLIFCQTSTGQTSANEVMAMVAGEADYLINDLHLPAEKYPFRATVLLGVERQNTALLGIFQQRMFKSSALYSHANNTLHQYSDPDDISLGDHDQHRLAFQVENFYTAKE
jgi:hypothetical protein